MVALLVDAFQWEPVRINTHVDLVVSSFKPGQLNRVQGDLTGFLYVQVNACSEPSALDGVHFFGGDCRQGLVEDVGQRRKTGPDAEPEVFAGLSFNGQLSRYSHARDTQLPDPEVAVGQRS